MNIEIRQAYDDLDNIKTLFLEYAQSIEVDLCFQDFNTELDRLPGKYANPDGRLYIAYVDNKVAGCIALRRYDENRAELKRLFIRNEFRQLGISKKLVNQIISDAKEIGYKSILLDTLNTMTAAMNLYQSVGFKEIEPYYANPLDGATYFELILNPERKQMMRKDREVTDINELLSIIQECHICRIGMQDEQGLYIVPLNFGYEYNEGQLNLYFHSAKVGRKIDALKQNNNVCIEMDCDHRLIEGEKACDYSFGFKSIIGNGKAYFVEDYEQKIKGLNLIMHHETQRTFDFDEKMVNIVSVIKVCVHEFSGKYHR